MVENVVDGDRRSKLALAELAERGDLLAAEALFRAGLALERDPAAGAAAQAAELFALGSAASHCSSLHKCGALAEAEGRVVEAHGLYTRAVAAAGGVDDGAGSAATSGRSLKAAWAWATGCACARGLLLCPPPPLQPQQREALLLQGHQPALLQNFPRKRPP
jgi:hypothetical protein